jgi:hypothetical protein
MLKTSSNRSDDLTLEIEIDRSDIRVAGGIVVRPEAAGGNSWQYSPRTKDYRSIVNDMSCVAER